MAVAKLFAVCLFILAIASTGEATDRTGTLSRHHPTSRESAVTRENWVRLPGPSTVAVVLDESSRILLTAGTTQFKVWYAQTLQPVAGPVQLDCCTAADLSIDGKTVIAACGREAQVFDTASGKLQFSLKSAAAVNAIDVSPDGKLLLTGSKQGEVRTWDHESGKEIFTKNFGKDVAVKFAKFSPDNKWVYSIVRGDFNSPAFPGVRVRCYWWEASTGKNQDYCMVDDPHYLGQSWCDLLTFSPSGKRVGLLTDGNLNLFQLGRGALVGKVTTGEVIGNIASVAFCGGDNRVAVSGDLDKVYLWNAVKDKVIDTLPASEGARLLFSHPNGCRIAGAWTTGKIAIWNWGRDDDVKLLTEFKTGRTISTRQVLAVDPQHSKIFVGGDEADTLAITIKAKE